MVDNPIHSRQKPIIGFVNRILGEHKGFISEDPDIDKIIAKRFGALQVTNTTENKRAFYNVVLTTDSEYSKYISACILSPDVLNQHADTGISFLNLLRLNKIFPGACIEMEPKPFFHINNESFVECFDDLADNCKKLVKDGCIIAKWRAVFQINDQAPSRLAVDINCMHLARFAALCQHADMVPILEIDFINEGDYDLIYVKHTHQKVMATLILALIEMRVVLEAIILQTDFVLPGPKCEIKYTINEIALATVEMLRRTVPPAIKGIAFLSSNFDEADATTYLNAVNQIPLTKPWKLTFAYGRALTISCLRIWGGLENCTPAAQWAFLNRCKANAYASEGTYDRCLDIAYPTMKHFNCKNCSCKRRSKTL